jgi:hypothetical protein
MFLDRGKFQKKSFYSNFLGTYTGAKLEKLVFFGFGTDTKGEL